MLLKELDKEALLHCEMCLGEGTGAANAFPGSGYGAGGLP